MKYEVLKAEIIRTLDGPPLRQETVIEACDLMSREILAGKYDRVAGAARAYAEPAQAARMDAVRAQAAQMNGERAQAARMEAARAQAAQMNGKRAQVARMEAARAQAARMLSRPWLEERLRRELPPLPEGLRRYPLGVLLHIGAGNMEGLAAYSALEGLLAGNINLVKLPEGESGLSGFLLRSLVAIRPELKPYLYVFRIPSSDQGRMKRLAGLADGIAVWGGDGAVEGVRRLARPSTKLIEWGHKISFAYATPRGTDRKGLKALARHMLETEQVLCSSCQGIYLDTADQFELEKFGKLFLEILEAEAADRGDSDLGLRARNTLRVQTGRLEGAAYGGKKIFAGKLTSVTLEEETRPGVSMMYGNCWVKALPRREIIRVLRDDAGYLQTVGLLAGEQEREELARLFYRAGAVRVCAPGGMSELPSGGVLPRDGVLPSGGVLPRDGVLPSGGVLPHDGEFPLARYSRIVS